MREPNKLTNRYLNGRKLALLELLTEPKKNNKNANLLYLASPGPHVLAVYAVQVSQVPDGVINLLGNKLDFTLETYMLLAIILAINECGLKIDNEPINL